MKYIFGITSAALASVDIIANVSGFPPTSDASMGFGALSAFFAILGAIIHCVEVG